MDTVCTCGTHPRKGGIACSNCNKLFHVKCAKSIKICCGIDLSNREPLSNIPADSLENMLTNVAIASKVSESIPSNGIDLSTSTLVSSNCASCSIFKDIDFYKLITNAVINATAPLRSQINALKIEIEKLTSVSGNVDLFSMEKVNVAMVNRPMNEDWTHDGEISPIGISPTILNGLPCTVSDPNDGSDNVVSSAASNHASEVNAVRKQAEHPNNTYTTTTTTILTENKSNSIPNIYGSSELAA